MKSLLCLLVAISVSLAGEAHYDPLQAAGEFQVHRTAFTYDQREVPLKIYLPGQQRAPLILLSHGLGGSREAGTYLGEHWAARGFVVVAMQHAGSDEEVWKDVPRAQRLASMKAAVNGASFTGRMRDVPATLDQLEEWNQAAGHFLHGRMDLGNIGMAGHSYGAITTQALCGQSYRIRGQAFADDRIDAGLALSPSPPQFGDAAVAFGNITRPMMLMTGTEDQSVIGQSTPEARRKVYAAMPPGSKYQLVLDGAGHMAFSDLPERVAPPRHLEYHTAIKTLSTAFWEAYLKKNTTARTWVDGDQPTTVLADKDLWQRK